MPEFVYEALNDDGSVESGRLAADSEVALEETLRARGAYLIKAYLHATASDGRLTDGTIDSKDLLAFTEYLAGAMQVGLPLVDILGDVQMRVRSKRLRQIIPEISTSITEHGKSLSEALAEHPKAFSPLFIGTVAAGEASGHMDYALSQLVEYLDWQQEINSQLRQAMMYPMIVFAGIGMLVAGLVGLVYPRLLPVLTRYDVDLPLPTRVVMSLAVFLREYWLIVIAGCLLGVVGFWAYTRTEHGARVRDILLLRMPIFGPLVREINMARLVTYLALFYRTGVELVLSLTLIENIIGNRMLSDVVRRVRERVVQGDSLGRAFGDEKLVPVVVVRAIALGESTGKLDDSLQRVRAYYAREIPAAVKRMTTALQPAIVVLLGAIVLLVALSIILPILSIYESIGGRR